MKQLNKKIFLLALILAIITTILFFFFLKGIKENGDIGMRTILVAAKDILPGQKITIEMIQEIKVPKSSYTGGGLDQESQISGKIAKEKILQGETFPSGRLAQQNETGLPYLIPSGKRAISIPVDQYKGVADLIQPNDIVDVYVTLPEKSDASGAKYPDTAKLFLQKIQVLAISKQTQKSDTSRMETPDVYAITLAVTPQQGEKLIFAQQTASITLALRGVNDNSQSQTTGIVRQGF